MIVGDEKEDGNKYLFEIATFLAISARNCIDEPPLYGPFRLIDALSRLTELPKFVKCLKQDEFLREIKAEIDEKKYLVMSDPEGFKKFLDGLVIKITKELKRRSFKQP